MARTVAAARTSISSLPKLAPLRMAARKMDGLPLEMNRLFPTFPSLPALNHFAAAAGIEAAARLRDAIEGRREEKGREKRVRAIRKEKMSNKSPDIGSHFTRRRLRRRRGGDHF